MASTLPVPGTWPADVGVDTVQYYYRNSTDGASEAQLSYDSNSILEDQLQTFIDSSEFISPCIPGNFPEEVTHEDFGQEYILRDSIQGDRSDSHRSSRSSGDEGLMDHWQSNRIMATEDTAVGESSSQTAPPLTAKNPFFLMHTPPPEIFRTTERSRTMVEMGQLLTQPVVGIEARYREELESQVAATRPESSLATGVRDSSRPAPARTLRSSGFSEESLSSNDSGYGSMAPQSRPSHVISNPKKLLGLILGRKKKKAPLSTTDPVPQPPTSQVSSTAASTDSGSVSLVAEPMTGECVSCLEDFSRNKLIKLTCHNYCVACFQALVNTALTSEAQWPPKCCLNPIAPATILHYINQESKQKYKEKDLEWKIPAAERVYCAVPNCGTFISPKNINKGQNCAKCPTCRKKACTICRGEYHNGRDCPDDPSLRATNSLAEVEGWRRCYSCHAYVERSNGCRHMTCRCKAQFCYICGLRWRTCACTDAGLEPIRLAAIARRQEVNQRTAAETAEAARRAQEDREILAEVEAFERREAERHARIAAVERRAAEQERRRREAERAATVYRRYKLLKAELLNVHNIQERLLNERWALERESLEKERHNALEIQVVRHDAEVQLQHAISQEKISDAEARFQQEYQARHLEERRIEERYREDLVAFYRHREGGDEKVRKAVQALDIEQQRDYKIWDSYRRKQLHDIAIAEKRKMQELGESHKREISDTRLGSEKTSVEWKRKMLAEARWFEEVKSERAGMLERWQQEDYARDS